MRFRSSLLALPALALAVEQPAQIFISPRPVSSPLTTSPREANALLSSHLGIAEYEHAPSAKHWTALGMPLGSARPPWEEEQSDSLIIMLEGSSDCLPSSLTREGATLLINSPPAPEAFDALISVYLRRVARTFGLHLAEIHGIEAFAHSAASTVEAWADWAVDGLHESWNYIEDLLHLKPDFSTPVEPKPEYARLLTELNFVDQSGSRLVAELNELDRYVESLSDAPRHLDGDSPYAQRRPSIAALRFSGLVDIERVHGRASKQYKQASELFAGVLDAAVAAFHTRTQSSGKVVTLVIPPKTARPLLKKRAPHSLLAPFSTRPRMKKRASDDKPLVSSSQCYSDEDSCKNATDSCSGHGECTQGARYGGGSDSDCYVCKCSTTKKKGRKEYWAGAACQKQDYSNQFVLLAGTSVALIVFVAASVALLTKVGDEELPSTLSAISGMMPKHE